MSLTASALVLFAEISQLPQNSRRLGEPALATQTEEDANERGKGSSSAWQRRPFAFELHLGIATPVGGVGLTADYSPWEWVSIGCGLGTNFVGPEGACNLRLRYVAKPESSFYIGIGVSGGPHSQTEATRFGLFGLLLGPLSQMGEGPYPSAWHWDFAKWFNLELGFEQRRYTGSTFRVYVGIANLLNPSNRRPVRSRYDDENRRDLKINDLMVYGGLALGRAL